MNIYKLISGVTGKNLPFSLKNISRTLLDMILKTNKKVEELESKIDNLGPGGSTERSLELEAFDSFTTVTGLKLYNSRIIKNYDPDIHGKYYYNAGFIDINQIQQAAQDGNIEEIYYQYAIFDYDTYMAGSNYPYNQYTLGTPVPDNYIPAPDNPRVYDFEGENQIMPDELIEQLRGKSFIVGLNID